MADLPNAKPGPIECPWSGRGVFRLGIFICLLFTTAALAGVPASFWAPQIDSALQARDLLFRTVLHAKDSFPVIELDRQAKNECLDRLDSLPDSGHVWNILCRGLLESYVAGVAETEFGTCLDSASGHPGELWVLFVEFTRNSQTKWADRCLLRLEKQLLEAGGTSAPVIGRQLMYYGVTREKQHDFEAADRYFAWAQRFDPDQPWSLLHRARIAFPSHLQLSLHYLGGIEQAVIHSWSLQLALFSHVYAWLRLIVMVWVTVVFTGLSLRHLPRSVHPLADRLPESIAPAIRTGLVMTLVAAASSFGAIPFLWLLAFLIVPFLEKREKFLFIAAVLFLVAAPLDSRIREIGQARNPESSVSIYLRASREGYSAGIQRFAAEKVAANPGDGLALMALSRSLVKSGDVSDGRLAAMSALSLHADDPEAISCAAEASYAIGDFSTAADYYRQIAAKRPLCYSVRYNLAQCKAREIDTAINLDFIQSLRPADQYAVKEFISLNNACFAYKWPQSRQLMSDLSWDMYFRTPYFKDQSGTWHSSAEFWGGSFFGLSPLLSMVLFIFPFCALLFAEHKKKGAWARAQAISSCAICKRTICSTCCRGSLCHPCFHAISAERKGSPETLKAGIKTLHDHRRAMTALSFDIVLPGSGMVFASTHRWWVIVLIGSTTAVILGSCIYLMTLHLSYPMWVIYGKPGEMAYWFFAYNLLFAVRMVVAAAPKRGEQRKYSQNALAS